jgi:hypothetical protein
MTDASWIDHALRKGKSLRRNSWPRGRWLRWHDGQFETSKRMDDGTTQWLLGRALWPVDEAAINWVVAEKPPKDHPHA